MEFPALVQQVVADVEDLVERSKIVVGAVRWLATDHERERSVALGQVTNEVPWSPNELLAQLNGIAYVAYRLARSVRPLIDARARHLSARSDSDGGRR
jgi:hypothetical protein